MTATLSPAAVSARPAPVGWAMAVDRDEETAFGIAGSGRATRGCDAAGSDAAGGAVVGRDSAAPDARGAASNAADRASAEDPGELEPTRPAATGLQVCRASGADRCTVDAAAWIVSARVDFTWAASGGAASGG